MYSEVFIRTIPGLKYWRDKVRLISVCPLSWLIIDDQLVNWLSSPILRLATCWPAHMYRH